MGHGGNGVRACLAGFKRGRDVEDDDLVDALDVVAPRELGGIASLAQALEVDALDDAPVANVEAGNDAFGQHGCHTEPSQLRRILKPALPDFSGWNCTPETRPSSTAAEKATP